MKAEIHGRAEVNALVRSFYSRVQQDELLGPVFASMIHSEEAWERHFETLTDFWETNLFFVAHYRGNPIQAHVQVDAANDGAIGQQHFDRWYKLWTRTVDDLFIGEKAYLAKTRAQNMAQLMLLKIQMARPTA